MIKPEPHIEKYRDTICPDFPEAVWNEVQEHIDEIKIAKRVSRISGYIDFLVCYVCSGYLYRDIDNIIKIRRLVWQAIQENPNEEIKQYMINEYRKCIQLDISAPCVL